jgi:hypothetical protein
LRGTLRVEAIGDVLSASVVSRGILAASRER